MNPNAMEAKIEMLPTIVDIYDGTLCRYRCSNIGYIMIKNKYDILPKLNKLTISILSQSHFFVFACRNSSRCFDIRTGIIANDMTQAMIGRNARILSSLRLLYAHNESIPLIIMKRVANQNIGCFDILLIVVENILTLSRNPINIDNMP